MLRSYLKIAWRNLRKHRVFTALNVGGLAVGMAAFLLLVQYVWFERSYDRQSLNAPHIWRVYTESYNNGTLDTRDANTHSAIGPTLKAQLPDVVDYARIYNARDLAVFRNQTPLLQERAYATDPGFLRMFPYRVIYGNAAHALDRPNTVVLTASTARRYFGDLNPVGRTLRMAGGWFNGLQTVTAVIEDAPATTHFKFEMLLAYQTLYSQGHRDNWENYWDYTYLQFRPDLNGKPISSDKVQARLTALSNEHLKQSQLQLKLQPLLDIHLHSDLTYEHEPNGSARMVYFLMLIAAIILAIAWVNYSNLTTARALTRAKEVGLRKTIGATRPQLVGQFLGEAFLMNALALVLAVLLVRLSGPAFDELTGRPLSSSDFVGSPAFVLTLAGLFVVSVLGSGLYPSLALSGYGPLWAFRLPVGRLTRGWGLRRVLVTGQLVCTVVLLVATFVVFRQLHFMQSHDLGLSIQQTLVVKAPLHDYREDSIYRSRYDVFRAEALQQPGIRHMAGSSVVPGDGINGIGGTSNGVFWKKNRATHSPTFYFVYVDEQFMDAFGVRRLAGDGFGKNPAQWRNQYVLNRAAQKALGFPSPEAAPGESLVFGGSNQREGADARVMGVVEDFHIESLKAPTRPTLYMCQPGSRLAYYSFKLNTTDVQGSVERLGALWKRLYPDSPFTYFFLDQKFNEQYRAERQFSRLFTLFTGLAILVACLGLFGLATFTAEQRTKEIGIRKVLGASALSLATLLSKDFLKLAGLAILIASPLAWWAMSRWLADFAYRVSLDWWVFVGAGLLATGIALLTVSFQSIRAALTNPVKSLRSE
jgi:putative ABC transport system permease protein